MSDSKDSKTQETRGLIQKTAKRETELLTSLEVSESEEDYEDLGLVIVRVYIKLEHEHRFRGQHADIGSITGCLNVLEGLLSELKRQALLANPTNPEDTTTLLKEEADALALTAPVIVRRIDYFNPLEAIFSLVLTAGAAIAAEALIRVALEEVIELGKRLITHEQHKPAVEKTIVENSAHYLKIFGWTILEWGILQRKSTTHAKDRNE